MSGPNGVVFIGDCLDVIEDMPTGIVDLIYADPPFNSGRDYRTESGEFGDRWQSSADYMNFMHDRLVEMRRILKPTGSIYLHCDPAESHYLKVEMDKIFDRENFRNEIVWCYSTSGRPKRFFAKKHDVLLFYSLGKGHWNDFRIAPTNRYLSSHYRQRDRHGNRCRIRYDNGKKRTYYPEEGIICNDWWQIPYVNSRAKERTGYPTQKPLALLERIIAASSNPGDLVLDPFCGSGTTLVAAQKLDREFIGIDISEKAAKVSNDRLAKTTEPLFERVA